MFVSKNYEIISSEVGKRSKSDVLTVHETYLSPYEENTSTVDGMKFEVDWSHIIDIVTQFL